MNCKNCGEPIVQIHGAGWFHTTQRIGRVREQCYEKEPLPRAEPPD